VHCVRLGQVQQRDGSIDMHTMCTWQVQQRGESDDGTDLCHLWVRDVFYNSRGLRKFDMHRLSVKLQLACGVPEPKHLLFNPERSFDGDMADSRLEFSKREFGTISHF
jgi:hypothetical protein